MTIHKRLALALVAGIIMALLAWLMVDPASPVAAYTKEHAGLGYVLMLLNFPALLLTSSTVGNDSPLTLWMLAGACFVQWFALGWWVSSWRRASATPETAT